MSFVKTTTLAALLAGAAIPAAAANFSATAVTELNLRAGPGPEFEIVDVIAADGEVDVMGCLDTTEWCEVSYNGTEGWAYAAYLTALKAEQPVVLYQNAPSLEIATVTYEKDVNEGIAAAAGGTWGAAAGSLLVGGPAAVAAGAVLGATGAVLASEPEPEIVTYIRENPVEPIYLEGEVAVGAGVPETVEIVPVPEGDVAYLNVNQQTVIVDPESRRIVHVIR